mmetsp:Transcript_35365/g.63722  ORF Transcript_35365/g.63722 Transcript_35365/m.63722 type:complete len:139 (+) Transcript_35365:442-858(+)
MGRLDELLDDEVSSDDEDEGTDFLRLRAFLAELLLPIIEGDGEDATLLFLGDVPSFNRRFDDPIEEVGEDFLEAGFFLKPEELGVSSELSLLTLLVDERNALEERAFGGVLHLSLPILFGDSSSSSEERVKSQATALS